MHTIPMYGSPGGRILAAVIAGAQTSKASR